MLLERLTDPLVYPLECGTDEAGRGCLAGPVVAAAVLLPKGFSHPKLNDSKKMSAKDRNEVYDYIVSNALAYGIASASVEVIEDVNILNASILAMHAAVCMLRPTPDFVSVDGNQFKQLDLSYATQLNPTDVRSGVVPHECVVKGDGKLMNIAAASVLAKVSRDRLMQKLVEQYPGYGWETNAGYGTAKHIRAIRELGPTKWHRMSFLSNIK